MSRASDLVDNPPVRSSPHVPGDYPASSSQAYAVSSQLSLSQAVYARRAEYTRPHTVRIKIGTWNVAAFKGTDKDVGGWFVGGKGVSEVLGGLSIHSPVASPNSNAKEVDVDLSESLDEQENRSSRKSSTIPKNDPGSLPGGEEVGIYALGLQEIVDISSATEALRPYNDPGPPNKIKDALAEALPPGYQLVAEQQLIGLLLLIYASPSVAPHVSSVSTTSVGTGLMGYMGNKGAVTARIVLGESTRLVFVNCHMSSGAGSADLDRRNWDAAQIMSRTRFDPITDSLGMTMDHGEKIGDEDFAFWFGDLNYRIKDVPPNDVRRLLMLHSAKQYREGSVSDKMMQDEILDNRSPTETNSNDSQIDTSAQSPLSSGSSSITDQVEMESAAERRIVTLDDLEADMQESSDPASLQTTINSLMAHDELTQQQKQKKVFHDGWREGPITFLPTYKYDPGRVSVFDTGEKRRGPSWCDRILYRTRKDRAAHEKLVEEEKEAKKRDADLKAHGIDKAAEDEETLFEYDPDADGENEEEEAAPNAEENDPRTVINKDGQEDMIALEFYTSHQRVLSSDHKPLEAVFTLKYDAAMAELKTKVQEEVARELDRAENEGRPMITIVGDGRSRGGNPESDGIDFGEVRYLEPKTRSLTIANTGGTAAQFGFVSRLFGSSTEEQPTPSWLTANVDLAPDWDHSVSKPKKTHSEPESWSTGVTKAFTLHPGDTCSLDLTTLVESKELVRRLNDEEVLDDVLVLRVKEGRDHFLTVRGSWQKSSHGNTIEKLIRIPEGGVRKLQGQRPSGSRDTSRSDLSKDDTKDKDAVMWSAPREILRLTEAIETLVERIVAEYSMLGDVPEGGASLDPSRPPWESHAGWPFAPESWTLTDASVRAPLRVAAHEALDTDAPLDAALPTDLPLLHRLEILAEVLFTFLSHLTDGVITASLFADLQSYFFVRGHPSPPQPLEERRAAALEILAQKRQHSVSFVLVTSMLSRVALEVSNATSFHGARSTQTSSLRRKADGGGAPLPASSPKVSVRRRTLDADPAVARRQLVRLNYAALFADVLVRDDVASGESAGGKSKQNATAVEAEKRELLELFLEGDAGRGPRPK